MVLSIVKFGGPIEMLMCEHPYKVKPGGWGTNVAMPPFNRRAVTSLGELGRPSHTSKMALSNRLITVRSGSPDME